jgi:flagellin
MISVNTNTNAMTALQYLNKTNAAISKTQTAISTGLKIASARDDGATFAIAQNMRGDVAAYGAVTDSLNRGISTIDVAVSAGETVSDLLVQMRNKATGAADPSLDSTSRKTMQQDFGALVQQIKTVVKNASFNGTNLLDGGKQSIQALASTDGKTRITVSPQNFSLGSTILSKLTLAASISSAGAASTMVTVITAALKSVDSALAKLSAGAKKISIQLSFVSKLSDALTAGIGNLVDADMSSESANLTALQTRQQLGVQSLAIANASTSIALSLFQ